MPLTKAQVQLAFKRARAHFKGKIPKGTKLARFVKNPSHHTAPHSTRTTHHSPSRKHRVSGAVKSVASKHPKLVNQAVNGLSAAIAFSPEIASAVTDAQNGNWQRVPAQALGHITAATTGFDPGDSSFDANKLKASIAAKAGGYAFNKVAKYFLKRFRM